MTFCVHVKKLSVQTTVELLGWFKIRERFNLFRFKNQKWKGGARPRNHSAGLEKGSSFLASSKCIGRALD